MKSEERKKRRKGCLNNCGSEKNISFYEEKSYAYRDSNRPK